ncbi:hypothetical protein [Anabaena subtropica]|uniref:Uncharacterized protein n=1 Tax=Anabaena subtropica FACHB-260 TaxID=2692884 RepID=A0ABR8CMH5_9NOST|nr:hypothetical protein [Anabaena subtropica]MBD2344395.1 hypothetical protein [Anabaena subtropica FACHB-260]
MFKQNLEFSTELLRQLTNTDKPLPYRQPKIYSLGSLEQIQAYNSGSMVDGPIGALYYRG